MDRSNINNMSAGSYVLNGLWKIATDAEDVGILEKWFEILPKHKACEAPVPGIIQQVFPDYHGVVWYWHEFRSSVFGGTESRHILKFGAVEYLADVWLNGRYLGRHEGGETPFTFDVTGLLLEEQESLLAVRVLNPTEVTIDGIILKETPHRNKEISNYCPGKSFNSGGITRQVELHTVPVVRIADVFIRPKTFTGEIKVMVYISNGGGSIWKGCIIASARASLSCSLLACNTVEAEFKAGESLHELTLHISQPHFWSTEDPYLYTIDIELSAECSTGKLQHKYSAKCGFRDFEVKNGYFHLNSRRIFLRSTHTTNHFPICDIIPQEPGLMRKDLIYAKASGFNMVRFIAGVAHPEQLDFCDEIGLMVYEESCAAWGLEDSLKMAERYNESIFGMVRRDRNHPSIVIWGLLNETFDGPVFKNAHSCLAGLREIDDTRLVILSSGRWDQKPGIGSVSNPGGIEWEHVWGDEAPDMLPLSEKDDTNILGYYKNSGDAHFYPVVPQSKVVNNIIRTMGSVAKPVFLSEYGIGSMLDVIHAARMYEQVGARADLYDAKLITEMAVKFEVDFNKYRMEEVYSFPEDLLRESQRFHASHRLLGFNLIRSNPGICGYNLTGMLDHGITGEGLWTFWREWKPGITDALSNGWASLRWCLFVDPMHTYSGRPFRLEAVLANEDVLKPGKYPVCFRISGPSGIVWEKDMVLDIPVYQAGMIPPLAINVLDEEVCIKGGAGLYEFAACMKRGGAPAGDRLRFYISNPTSDINEERIVTSYGLEENTVNWLESHGVCCKTYGETAPGIYETILIGDLSKSNISTDEHNNLINRISKGSTAVFLAPELLKYKEDSTGWLPVDQRIKCTMFFDWVYHREFVAKQHPIFEGLQNKGIMDWDYYGQILSPYLFEVQHIPDDIAAVTFATGYNIPTGYVSGILFGTYRLGDGRFVINAFSILDNLDINPAADRMLLNIIRYAQEERERR